MSGIARVEVFLEAVRATKDIQLSVTRPDGSAWTVKGRRFATGVLDWSGPGGEPLEPGTYQTVTIVKGLPNSLLGERAGEAA